MSLSHRAARTVRLIGVSTAATALALGVANTALACDIHDFSAVAACDDTGHGVIRVTDKDASGTPATVTLYIRMSAVEEGDRNLGTKTIDHPTAQGVTVEFAEDWAPEVTYRIHIKAGDQVDEDITPFLITPSTSCQAAETTPPAEATPTPQPSETVSATPSASESSAAAVVSSAPSPAGGGSVLAETGGGNGTGLIAGTAAALVAVGGGVVFALRRRGTVRSH